MKTRRNGGSYGGLLLLQRCSRHRETRELGYIERQPAQRPTTVIEQIQDQSRGVIHCRLVGRRKLEPFAVRAPLRKRAVQLAFNDACTLRRSQSDACSKGRWCWALGDQGVKAFVQVVGKSDL